MFKTREGLSFREDLAQQKAKRLDRMSDKALDKARVKGYHTATILATGRADYEGLLDRGWTLVQAQGQRVLIGLRQYEMTKRVLGRP